MFASFRSAVSRFENKENGFTVQREDLDASCVNNGLAISHPRLSFMCHRLIQSRATISDSSHSSSINCTLHCEMPEIYWNSSVPSSESSTFEQEGEKRKLKVTWSENKKLFESIFNLHRPTRGEEGEIIIIFISGREKWCFRWGSLATTRRWERSLLLIHCSVLACLVIKSLNILTPAQVTVKEM